jgi:hypothetical protein
MGINHKLVVIYNLNLSASVLHEPAASVDHAEWPELLGLLRPAARMSSSSGVSAMDWLELRQQSASCRRSAFAIGRANVSHTLHELADEYDFRTRDIEEDVRSGLTDRQDVNARC